MYRLEHFFPLRPLTHLLLARASKGMLAARPLRLIVFLFLATFIRVIYKLSTVNLTVGNILVCNGVVVNIVHRGRPVVPPDPGASSPTPNGEHSRE